MKIPVQESCRAKIQIQENTGNTGTARGLFIMETQRQTSELFFARFYCPVPKKENGSVYDLGSMIVSLISL